MINTYVSNFMANISIVFAVVILVLMITYHEYF